MVREYSYLMLLVKNTIMQNTKKAKILEALGQQDIELHLEREVPLKMKKVADDMVVYHFRPVAKHYGSLQFV